MVSATLTARAQDCQTDEDCGHGFECLHLAGTSAVTGAGGSSMPECGDDICETGLEDVESCPEDCDNIQVCAPVACTDDADCAEGYECRPEESAGSSSFTSGGGSSGSSCGDGICDSDETEDSCPEDCSVQDVCQVVETPCTSDEDCADGFYCFLPAADGATSVASVDTSGSSDVASGDTGGTSGSDAATDGSAAVSGGGGGAANATSEAGVCWPETADIGSVDGTDGSSSSTAGGAATGGEATNGGSATGQGGTEQSSAASGGDSLSATGSDGGGGESGSSDSGSSDSGSGGAGGGNSDDEGGCSCSMPGSTKTPTNIWFLLSAGGLTTFGRRRRQPRRTR